MINELTRKEVREKLIRHLDDSYVIISIADLREIIPELYDIVSGPPKKLNPPLSTPKKKEPEIMTIAELEQKLIKESLSRTGGCVREAAKLMEISERSFYRKLKNYGIKYEEYRKETDMY